MPMPMSPIIDDPTTSGWVSHFCRRNPVKPFPNFDVAAADIVNTLLLEIDYTILFRKVNKDIDMTIGSTTEQKNDSSLYLTYNNKIDDRYKDLRNRKTILIE